MEYIWDIFKYPLWNLSNQIYSMVTDGTFSVITDDIWSLSGYPLSKRSGYPLWNMSGQPFWKHGWMKNDKTWKLNLRFVYIPFGDMVFSHVMICVEYLMGSYIFLSLYIKRNCMDIFLYEWVVYLSKYFYWYLYK